MIISSETIHWRKIAVGRRNPQLKCWSDCKVLETHGMWNSTRTLLWQIFNLGESWISKNPSPYFQYQFMLLINIRSQKSSPWDPCGQEGKIKLNLKKVEADKFCDKLGDFGKHCHVFQGIKAIKFWEAFFFSFHSQRNNRTLDKERGADR